jgi:hypothetical protein
LGVIYFELLGNSVPAEVYSLLVFLYLVNFLVAQSLLEHKVFLVVILQNRWHGTVINVRKRYLLVVYESTRAAKECHIFEVNNRLRQFALRNAIFFFQTPDWEWALTGLHQAVNFVVLRSV